MGTDADRREDARREELDDRLDRRGVRCEDCGYRWVPGRGCCPICGGAIGEPGSATELSHVERFGTTDAGFEERILDAEIAAAEPSDVHPRTTPRG